MHCMVVNTAVHALMYQSEQNLKRALAAKSSSHEAHTKLILARSKIHMLESRERAQKELLMMLMSEKEGLQRKVENLGALVKEWTEILLKAMEEAKVKAVEEFKSSEEFESELIEAGSEDYHKGFKLSRWLTKREFP